MRLPTWEELIPEQLEIREYPLNQPLFVAGPPGSGKTVLAVQRAEAASREGKTVVLVTYNRMLRRLTTLLRPGSAVPSTMHSFVYHDYRKRTGTALDKYDHNWSRMLINLKKCSSSETACDHVVVDEGQDFPEGFFQYLFEHVTSILTVFADEDQAVGDRRTTLKQIRAAANLPRPIYLKENHRNTPEIASLAEHFHSGVLPAAITRRAAVGQRPTLIAKTGISETAEFIATWFENRGGTVGVVVSRNRMECHLLKELSARLPKRRIDFYDSNTQNEDRIHLLDEGVTILNKKSVKGQEFDTVFILELEQFIPCINDAMKRAMYMMCSRARDYLFLVSGCPLSSKAIADLPGPKILERG